MRDVVISSLNFNFHLVLQCWFLNYLFKISSIFDSQFRYLLLIFDFVVLPIFNFAIKFFFQLHVDSSARTSSLLPSVFSSEIIPAEDGDFSSYLTPRFLPLETIAKNWPQAKRHFKASRATS